METPLRKNRSLKPVCWKVTINDGNTTLVKTFDKKEEVGPFLGLSQNAVNYRLRNTKTVNHTLIEKVDKEPEKPEEST